MLRSRFVIFALIAAFLVHPVGLANADVERISEYADVSAASMIDVDAKAKVATERRAHFDRHDHRGGVCCSTTGMCIAILMEDFRIFEFGNLGYRVTGSVRALTARTVDALLHPPKVLS